MEPNTIALIASAQIILLAFVQGLLLVWKSKSEAKIRSAEKHEDYARQDEVAERLAKASVEVERRADLLAKAQAETIKRTDEVAKVAATANDLVQTKLKEIHTLVNSDMTAARAAERDSQVLLVLSLKRTHMLSAKLGEPPSKEELELLAAAEKRIEELNQILADRKAAQDIVDKESAKEKH